MLKSARLLTRKSPPAVRRLDGRETAGCIAERMRVRCGRGPPTARRTLRTIDLCCELILAAETIEQGKIRPIICAWLFVRRDLIGSARRLGSAAPRALPSSGDRCENHPLVSRFAPRRNGQAVERKFRLLKPPFNGEPLLMTYLPSCCLEFLRSREVTAVRPFISPQIAWLPQPTACAGLRRCHAYRHGGSHSAIRARRGALTGIADRAPQDGRHDGRCKSARRNDPTQISNANDLAYRSASDSHADSQRPTVSNSQQRAVPHDRYF